MKFNLTECCRIVYCRANDCRRRPSRCRRILPAAAVPRRIRRRRTHVGRRQRRSAPPVVAPSSAAGLLVIQAYNDAQNANDDDDDGRSADGDDDGGVGLLTEEILLQKANTAMGRRETQDPARACGAFEERARLGCKTAAARAAARPAGV